ncbi:GUN4 domain-containing protein [Leptolyngbya sp. CCY15150]|uniref:GUN4 domain-containing protein n=1 Tax=Leptolyngbya sp. CCY15150 TaxID=2767772 RepID=UPI00194E6367|nr:GUN4 domain-containing protein [Leptolyngbya sp. CCY15150]
MSFIFISYSREDVAYIKRLVQALQQYELPVWLDEHTDDGTIWTHVLQEKVEACQAFLVVMTPRSYASSWVQSEVTYALELKKRIFPLLLEGNRWLSVSALQTVDVTNGELPPDKFFDGLCKLVPPMSSGSLTLSNDDDLSSERGIDYTRLRDLLKSGNWKTADMETYKLMIQAVGKGTNEWFSEKDCDSFPCTDLLTIDKLWTKYSKGRFGLSVQQQIYASCRAKLDEKCTDNEVWSEFCKQVGWRVDGHWITSSDVVYDMSALPGHLPGGNPGSRVWVDGFALGIWCHPRLLHRIEACNLPSEKGLDYSRLRSFLQACNWQAANQETSELMLLAVGKKLGDVFTPEELLSFPFTDLQTIDSLWEQYSQGKFGFSVQKQLYVSCGAKLSAEYPGGQVFSNFGKIVGWRVDNTWIDYDQVDFTGTAPRGHLPMPPSTLMSKIDNVVEVGDWFGFPYLAYRLEFGRSPVHREIKFFSIDDGSYKRHK